MLGFNIQAPWVTYNNKIKALFAYDDDIVVSNIYHEEDGPYTMKITVYNTDKFIALQNLLEKEVKFGNVALHINVIQDSHLKDTSDPVALFTTLFGDNMLIKDIRIDTDFTGTEHCFARFQPEVIQFFNDDTSDYNGNWSGLAQDIAKEVFANAPAGIHFCTASIRENSED